MIRLGGFYMARGYSNKYSMCFLGLKMGKSTLILMMTSSDEL